MKSENGHKIREMRWSFFLRRGACCFSRHCTVDPPAQNATFVLPSILHCAWQPLPSPPLPRHAALSLCLLLKQDDDDDDDAAVATAEWWTELAGECDGDRWQSHPTLLAAVRRRVVCDSHVMNVLCTFLLLRPRSRLGHYVVTNSEM